MFYFASFAIVVASANVHIIQTHIVHVNASAFVCMCVCTFCRIADNGRHLLMGQVFDLQYVSRAITLNCMYYIVAVLWYSLYFSSICCLPLSLPTFDG